MDPSESQSLEERAAHEKEKYDGIYSTGAISNYGHSNHGKGATEIVASLKPTSIVDVGCGYNEFLSGVRAANESMKTVGVDFSCPGADIKASADSLPFGRKEFDLLTAFDMLEHLLPEQVVPALVEFSRVSRRYLFSISYVESRCKWKGEGLHPTVKDETWWIDRIREAGGVTIKRGRYLFGSWASKPIESEQTIAVVGNGPSVLLRGNRGEEIDAHDQVVRFNAYAIEGFEHLVGRRTTLWSTFGRGMVPKDESERPRRIIFTHGDIMPNPPFAAEEVFGVNRTYYNSVRARVKAASTRKDAELERLLPSSGLMVILWLIEVHGAMHIDLYGLDHFRKEESGLHHYWVDKKYGKPKEHDGEIESAMLAPYIASGKIRHF